MQHKNSKKAKIVIEILGEIIREKREELGKSQRLLADEFGVEKSLINRMEKAVNEPKLISIFTVCELLKIKPSELIRQLETRLPDEFKLLEE